MAVPTDNPNSVASVVSNSGPLPPLPQTQNPVGPDQVPPGPGPQQFPVQPQPINPARAALGGVAQTAQMTPQQAKLAHSAAVGHGFKSIMSMLAPDSGAPISPTRRFFGSVISGAIAGAAAGSEGRENTAGSGWSAAGLGAGAAQKQQQQQALIAQQQKQQQFENQQKMQQAQREQEEADQKRIMNQAQIAMWHTQLAIDQHKSDMLDQEAIDRRNEASRALYNTYVAAGGKPPADPSVPATIDAYDLSKMYIDTKGKIAQAPGGMHRIFFDTTNGGEAVRDPITGTWSEDGKPVDMTAKTTFRVLDVPEDTMNTRTAHTGKEVNSALGYKQFPNDDATVMISPNEMTNLVTKRRQLESENNANSRAREAETAQEYKAAYDTFKATEDSLKGRLDELKASPTPDQNQINALETEQQQNVADFIAARDKLYPTLKGTSIEKAPPPPPAGDQKVTQLVQKYSTGLTPVASTNFAGGAQALQNGTPLSTVLKNLANSRDLNPADKTSISAALVKLNAELAPYIAQTAQANAAAQTQVQQQADIANEQENPSAATQYQLATTPAAVASRPGQR